MHGAAALLAVTGQSSGGGASGSVVNAVTTNYNGATNTVNLTTQKVGNLLVWMGTSDSNSASIASLSCANAGTWTRRIIASGANNGTSEIWTAPVTAVGATSVNGTYSGPRNGPVAYGCWELEGYADWNNIVGAEVGNGAGGVTGAVDFPTSTPAGTPGIVLGVAFSGGGMTAGATAGVDYDTSQLASYDTMFITAVNVSGAVTAAANLSSSDDFVAVTVAISA